MGMTRRCWYNGGKAIPSCTSCLGKWDTQGTSSLGYLEPQLSGACGHNISVADAIINNGQYAASIPASSAFIITWPSNELRVFGVKLNKNQLVSSGSHTVDSANLTIFDTVTATPNTVSGYSFSGTSPTNISITSPISYPAFNGDYLFLGVSGDGELYAFGSNSSSAELAKSSAVLSTANPLALVVSSSISSASYSTGFDIDVLTDASNISSVLTLPDMSADGITVVKDFCGNVVSDFSWYANYEKQVYWS